MVFIWRTVVPQPKESIYEVITSCRHPHLCQDLPHDDYNFYRLRRNPTHNSFHDPSPSAYPFSGHQIRDSGQSDCCSQYDEYSHDSDGDRAVGALPAGKARAGCVCLAADRAICNKKLGTYHRKSMPDCASPFVETTSKVKTAPLHRRNYFEVVVTGTYLVDMNASNVVFYSRGETSVL